MKKTIIAHVLDLIAPDYCYYCNEIGNLVCSKCLKEHKTQGYFIKNKNKSIIDCEIFIDERGGILRKIVDDYKFNNVKGNYLVLSHLMSYLITYNFNQEHLKQSVIVPIPTVKQHIRERGYDHIKLIADEISLEIGVEVETALIRLTSSRQRGSSAKQRQFQASKSYKAIKELDKTKIYILLDDIKTTGSTLEEAARQLKKAGAKKIYACYILHQSLIKN